MYIKVFSYTNTRSVSTQSPISGISHIRDVYKTLRLWDRKSKMYNVKTLIVYLVCGSCIALKQFERGAEFIERDEVSTSEGSFSWRTLLEEQPVAMLVELKAPLLEGLKKIMKDENNSEDAVDQITLATFDSMGLQEAILYNDTSEFRDAIMSLQPRALEKDMSSPTIHALTDLLRGESPRGSVLLVTMSKPSDEDFAELLLRSLIDNQSHLSVLWGGDEKTDDYLLLLDVAVRTGGKFKFVKKNGENLLKSDSDYFSGSIRFPDEQNDRSGEEMPLVSRAADQRVFQRAVVPLIVEVASGTSLEAKPGTPTQIRFNVKNNINVPVPVFFNAKYNGIAQMVQPTRTDLQPAETAIVIVNIQPIGIAQNVNAVGTVTLFAAAANKVTARSAIISTTPQILTDNYAPKMTYKFDGDCSNHKEPQNCENGHWNLEATFHDEDSGLLKILSEPHGLLFQSEFVAGTKTPVTVYYSATCCQPVVQIWAEDLKGNYVKKSFDVFNQNLLAGEIASIVLGILLLLLLILAIVVGIVLFRKRNQRNLIIPRARSNSR